MEIYGDLYTANIAMFPYVSGTRECGKGETYVGDVWRPSPNFREIQGGGERSIEVIKIIKNIIIL